MPGATDARAACWLMCARNGHDARRYRPRRTRLSRAHFRAITPYDYLLDKSVGFTCYVGTYSCYNPLTESRRTGCGSEVPTEVTRPLGLCLVDRLCVSRGVEGCGELQRTFRAHEFRQHLVHFKIADRAVFPRAPAAAVAHLLADFSTHPHSDHPWLVEDERGNYTEWSYRVSFECGARCAGAAAVRASAAGGGDGVPGHGRAPRHEVHLDLYACVRLPFLPWPKICDEMEIEWEVVGDASGAGCVVQERARGWCGALRVLSGACQRDLRAQRRDHLDRLRAAL